MLLKDKVAIVTGSSKGIGRGFVRRFAAEAARVVVNGRGAEAVRRTADEVRAADGTVRAVGPT